MKLLIQKIISYPFIFGSLDIHYNASWIFQENTMSDTEIVNGNKIASPTAEQLLALDEEERLEEEQQKIDKNPPIVFSDVIDVSKIQLTAIDTFFIL